MGLEQASVRIDSAQFPAMDLAARDVLRQNDMLDTIRVLREFDLAGYVGRLRENYRLDGIGDIGEVRNKKGRVVINGVTTERLADTLEKFSDSPPVMTDSELTNLKDDTLFSSPAELAYAVIDASMRMAGINETTVAHNRQKGWHFSGEDVWEFGQTLKKSLSTGTPLDREQVRHYTVRVSGVQIGKTVSTGVLVVALAGCVGGPDVSVNTPVVIETTSGETMVVEAGSTLVTAPAEVPPTVGAQPTESAVVSVETPGMSEKVWNGTEWVKVEPEIKPWVAPEIDLSPESDLVVKLNGIQGLDHGFTFRIEEGGKIKQFGKVGYLFDVVEHQITPDTAAIVLIVIEKQPDKKTYKVTSYVAGIDRGLANGGVGITRNTNNDFRKAFWNSEKLAFNPITRADLLAYYKAQVGDRVNHIAPRWNAQAEAFDPAVFARQVARPTAAGTPSNSGDPIFHVIPNFVLDYCKPGIPCNTEDGLLFPQSILEFD